MAMAASMAIYGHHHNNLHYQAPVFRSDSTLSNSSFASSHGGSGSASSGELLLLPLPYTNYMEKRQLFLRSYQFSRKKTLAERIKSSLFRFRRVICRRLRSVRRLRRVVWSKLRSALFRRRRRFTRLVQHYHAGLAGGGGSMITRRSGCSDSCFW